MRIKEVAGAWSPASTKCKWHHCHSDWLWGQLKGDTQVAGWSGPPGMLQTEMEKAGEGDRPVLSVRCLSDISQTPGVGAKCACHCLGG